MKGTLTYAIHTYRTLEEIKETYEDENTAVEFIEGDGDGISVHIHAKIPYQKDNVAEAVSNYFSETGNEAEIFSFKNETGEVIYTEEDEE
jgi:hypothetical protein